MILGLGVDLLENSRVEEELSRKDWTSGDGIFSSGELHSSRSSRHPARRLAACFAAKEAALKALEARAEDLSLFREVEAGEDADGADTLVFHGRLKLQAEALGVRRTLLSVSLKPKRASALVILEA